ncbi:hypothetical protein [Hahella ganghwensis]|uniref:hypothetical protein n=1 Tax=Hahella ganghwensis TaxID=286420 RepID=UPI000372815E|nr:hypothetical protein [Hahella ganghwensis]
MMKSISSSITALYSRLQHAYWCKQFDRQTKRQRNGKKPLPKSFARTSFNADVRSVDETLRRF